MNKQECEEKCEEYCMKMKEMWRDGEKSFAYERSMDELVGWMRLNPWNLTIQGD